MSPGLQRHQLAWLTQAGWVQVLEQVRAQCHEPNPLWDVLARDCLQHWARHNLPLVVTRQAPVGFQALGVSGCSEADQVAYDTPREPIAMGLPTPLRWHRRRVALHVPWAHVAAWGAFPALPQLLQAQTLATVSGERSAVLAGLQRVCEALAQHGLLARVHGSHGWELLSGLACVRPGSDIDVTVAVTGLAQADAAVAALQSAQRAGVPLDGELVWPDGRAVAWREWAAWRAGRAQAVLVKHLRGCYLTHEVAGFEPRVGSAEPARAQERAEAEVTA